MRTAVEMARAVAERRVTPAELVEEAVRRAEEWQPATNAFSQLHEDEALDRARSLGSSGGPLLGVPVAVKDLFDVAGWETTGCCAGYRGRIAGRDSEAVRRLRAAGAVVIGKTNQHELAAGATNQVSACGPTWNPWDRTRITGGSSGGSGAAVAAGVVPIALGTDTGGSIRIPASLCGTVGLKVSFGAVPLQGVMPLSPSMDTVGPLAGSVADAAIAFTVLGGGRPQEPTSAAGLRVGVPGGVFEEAAIPEVLAARERARDALAGAGASMVDGIGDLRYDPETWARIAWTELFAAHRDLLDEGSEALHRWTRAFLEQGRGWGEPVRQRGQGEALAVRRAFDEMLQRADVLLAPVTPTPAISAEVREVTLGDGRVLDIRRGAISLLTRPVNLAGLPAVSVPAGWSDEGLPLGVQLIGRPGDERSLLVAAEAIELSGMHEPRVPEPAG
jgi:Asp-tRNA(Asn)/Glu-tRNA(Gln) amidotransferase A subunit family amidase